MLMEVPLVETTSLLLFFTIFLNHQFFSYHPDTLDIPMMKDFFSREKLILQIVFQVILHCLHFHEVFDNFDIKVS